MALFECFSSLSIYLSIAPFFLSPFFKSFLFFFLPYSFPLHLFLPLSLSCSLSLSFLVSLPFFSIPLNLELSYSPCVRPTLSPASFCKEMTRLKNENYSIRDDITRFRCTLQVQYVLLRHFFCLQMSFN